MTSKNYLINAVDVVTIADRESIPTVSRYLKEGGVLIGVDALTDLTELKFLNDDFKIQLGKLKGGQSTKSRATFSCGDGQRRSAYALADDFFSALTKEATRHLAKQRLSMAKCVLVSEPLSFYAEEDADWLENYRDNIRRILHGKFDEIQFLPEPFAVYQYYRYGKRHSLVSQERKHCALIIDFGGGTFDVSVVETTKAGDIRQKGKHAKPLGAHSSPVGGFEINRQIASAIISSAYDKKFDKERIRKALTNYYRWRDGALDIEDLNVANRSFLLWLGAFLREIELAKLQLSKKIQNWNLNTLPTESITLEIPDDPFSEAPDRIPFYLSAEMLRDVFVREIWARKIKGCIKKAIKTASDALAGRPLDIVLLSGGSANLRWLEELIRREFVDDLQGAAIVSLREDYQEVVSKGLAIECARRGYEPNNEFSDVTYNPLFLVVNPDEKGEERKRYRLISTPFKIDDCAADSQLLSSACDLDIKNEEKITWRVRLDHPPKHHLKYYFLKDPTTTEDLESRYNFVESSVTTNPGARFDSTIQVQLIIRSDGTATPTFIYRTDQDGKIAESVTGEPFCIDLVSANQDTSRAAYIGIDFGTATSAVTYVDWAQIELFESREKDEVWLQLNELVDLPSLIAIPIKALLLSSQQYRLHLDV